MLHEFHLPYIFSAKRRIESLRTQAEFLVKNVAIRASCDLLHLLTACSAFDPSGSLNTRFLNNTLGQTWVLTCSSRRRKKKWNKKKMGARPRESHHKMITGSQLLLRYLLATYPVCCTAKEWLSRGSRLHGSKLHSEPCSTPSAASSVEAGSASEMPNSCKDLQSGRFGLEDRLSVVKSRHHIDNIPTMAPCLKAEKPL